MDGISKGFKTCLANNELIKKVDEAGRTYSKSFPNARMHVGSVAPSCEKHIHFNADLHTLANERNASFIPLESMFDDKGNLQQGMISGFHYTEKGVRTFATEIKRSLYGYYRQRNSYRQNLRPQNSRRPIQNLNAASNGAVANSKQELAKCLKMAIACLDDM